jgi:MYXO-CTERM domain-containing protein
MLHHRHISTVDAPVNMASDARMRNVLCVLSCAVALSLHAPSASAFCGFYVGGADAKLFNNATQVVLMREGTRTVLSMQNNYEGPPSNFAMVVPVPVVLQKENVKTLPKDIFAKVDALSAPRLVEYWEQDPCKPEPDYEGVRTSKGIAQPSMMAAPGGGSGGLGVKIEAQFTVGEYQIVILSAKDSNGLETWLKQEKYVIPEGAATFFKPYVQSGSKFFVARVDSSKVTFEKGQAMLSPLRFYYDSESFSLPVRLGLMNAKGPQDLIVNILAKNQRYEVANYPNVTIPTNYDVKDNAKSEFPTFYAALFDETVKKTPRAVVTEYAWDASTCDPCPGPALMPNDFYTLGADVLPSAGPKVIPAPGGPPRPGSGVPGVTGGGRSGPAPNGAPGGAPFVQMPFVGGFTITRLHARYTKESLGEDLVFKAAPAITGGREVRAKDNALEHGAQAAQYGANNFQGRYAVRHPWEGAIACDKPLRGRWGGPPGRDMWSQPPVPAKDTAFAPRGQTPLASYLVAAVTELDIKPSSPPAPLPTTPVAVSATPSVGTNAPMPPKEAPSSGGCGSCAETPSSASGAVGLFAMVALVLKRRRKH